MVGDEALLLGLLRLHHWVALKFCPHAYVLYNRDVIGRRGSDIELLRGVAKQHVEAFDSVARQLFLEFEVFDDAEGIGQQLLDDSLCENDGFVTVVDVLLDLVVDVGGMRPTSVRGQDVSVS